eukprot:Pgem_evm1s19181
MVHGFGLSIDTRDNYCITLPELFDDDLKKNDQKNNKNSKRKASVVSILSAGVQDFFYTNKKNNNNNNNNNNGISCYVFGVHGIGSACEFKRDYHCNVVASLCFLFLDFSLPWCHKSWTFFKKENIAQTHHFYG